MNQSEPKGLKVCFNPIGDSGFSKLFVEYVNLNRQLPNQIVILGEDSKEQTVEIQKDCFQIIPENIDELARKIEEMILGKNVLEIRRFHYDVEPPEIDKSIYEKDNFKQAKRNNFKSPNFNFRTKRK